MVMYKLSRSMNRVMFFYLALFFMACSSKQNSKEVNTDSLTPSYPASESVIGFLTWYKLHMMDLNAYNLVTNNGNESPDPSKPYSVNFPETEKYIAALQASGFVSNKFAENRRAYFKKCDEALKIEQQYDGPPMGFDADLIMLSQDFELDFLEQAKINAHPGGNTNSHIILEFPYGLKLAYAMTWENGKWLIDDIQNVSDR